MGKTRVAVRGKIRYSRLTVVDATAPLQALLQQLQQQLLGSPIDEAPAIVSPNSALSISLGFYHYQQHLEPRLCRQSMRLISGYNGYFTRMQSNGFTCNCDFRVAV